MSESGKSKHPGRPVKWTILEREKVRDALFAYITKTALPILTEFAYKNGYTRTQLYAFEELSDAIKACHEKKEAQLERAMLTGHLGKVKYTTTGCIFSLKQMGWRDQVSVQHSGGLDIHALTPEQIDERIAVLVAKHANAN